MTQLRCGGCGQARHEIYQDDDVLVAVCCDCKAKSVIEVQTKIRIEWPSNSSVADKHEDGSGKLAEF